LLTVLNAVSCCLLQASVFRHGLLKNPITVWGVSVSIATMLFITYAPFLQPIFGTAQLVGIGWVPMIGFAFFVFTYTEYGKKLSRRNPEGWWARNMQW
jgi:magnesium-transporting ATPase (P-type)